MRKSSFKLIEQRCEELQNKNATLTLENNNLSNENNDLNDKVEDLQDEIKEFNRVHHTLLLESAKITEDHKKLQENYDTPAKKQE